SGLQRRCDYFQVLSRRLALAGSWQSNLAKPSHTRHGACGKRCGFFSLNTLQRRSQGVLVLSGCLHCQGAQPDNCCCYQRCCGETLVDFSLELFHKTAFTDIVSNCQAQRQEAVIVRFTTASVESMAI